VADSDIRLLERSLDPNEVVAARRAKARAGKLTSYFIWPRYEVMGDSDGVSTSWNLWLRLTPQDASDIMIIGFDAFLRNTPICIVPYRMALATMVRRAVENTNRYVASCERDRRPTYGLTRLEMPDLSIIMDPDAYPEDIKSILATLRPGDLEYPGTSFNGAYGETSVRTGVTGLSLDYGYGDPGEDGEWPTIIPVEQYWTLNMNHSRQVSLSAHYPYIYNQDKVDDSLKVITDLQEIALAELHALYERGVDLHEYTNGNTPEPQAATINPMDLIEEE
jgi:hypothetical protein